MAMADNSMAQRDEALPEARSGGGLNEMREIDLVELFYRLIEKAKFIIGGAVLGVLVAGIYTVLFVTPMYRATTKLYVMSAGDSAINLSDLQIGTYLTNDYVEVFSTWEVNELVRQNLGLTMTDDELQDMLTVSNPSNTRILNISITSSDAALAALIANEYAAVAKKYISETMATDEPNVLSKALKPTKPIGPSTTRNLILGLLLGTILVVGVVAVQYLLDDKIKTADDIQKYADMPTLALVPLLNAQKSGPAKAGQGNRRRR